MSLQRASVEVIVSKGSFPKDQQFLRPCRVKISQSENTLLWSENTHTGRWITWMLCSNKKGGHRFLQKPPRTRWSIVKPRLKHSIRAFKRLLCDKASERWKG